MDRYDEKLIIAKTPVSSILLFVLAILITVIAAALCILTPPLGALLLAGGIALIVFSKDGLSTEFEYIITNGDIEIAKVLAKKKRKNLVLIEASSIARMALASDERVANDINIGKYKVRKYIGKEDSENRVAIYVGEGDNQDIYLLDLDEKCISHMNQMIKAKSSKKL